MRAGEYYLRLGAVVVAAVLAGLMIMKPNAGKQAVEHAARVAASVEKTPISARACAIGEPAFAGPFAVFDDVLSVSPLGGVTAPGEVLPAPYIRVNTRRSDDAFERRNTNALAPAKADIVAIERKTIRNSDGRAKAFSWTVHFQSCENISFYYDRLDEISETILSRAGAIDDFTEFGGPDHIARETSIRVQIGDVIGNANGFDIGLHDGAAAPATLERPERYNTNPFARAAVFDASPSLLATINPSVSHARCPIEYMAKDDKTAWESKLGDSWGIRQAKGENACRTALADKPGAAQGVWYTDASHNAATTKLSAIALSADAINPDRQVFALHGRLKSLTPDMVALGPKMSSAHEAAAKGFLSFKSLNDGSINIAFDKVENGQTFCYDQVRAGFVGPLIDGVFLLRRESGEEGPALLIMEARNDVSSCSSLEEPWQFTGNETVFYR